MNSCYPKIRLLTVPGGITNVTRRDNGQQLFKCTTIGKPLMGHAWAEIRLSDGSWIPVDPSTQLVGDTEEGIQTFQEAGYNAVLTLGIDAEITPGDFLTCKDSVAVIKPGETKAASNLSLLLRSSKPLIKIRVGGRSSSTEVSPTNIPYTDDAKLNIGVNSKWNTTGLRILSVENATS